MPKFAAASGFGVRDANRPGRRSAASRTEREVGCGNTNEGDLLTVGRPNWLGVAIDAGIEVGERLRGNAIDGDEGMIRAVGDKNQLGTIRGPVKLAGLTLGMDEL